MYGLLKENGPYLVEAKDPPFMDTHLVKNPHSWHKIANMLYIDNPINTGFSHSTQKWYWNDSSTMFDFDRVAPFKDEEVAKNLIEFLSQFIKLYWQYVNCQKPPNIYFFGESYGGTYVIKLAHMLVRELKINAELRQEVRVLM